jgi:hypothetical protein
VEPEETGHVEDPSFERLLLNVSYRNRVKMWAECVRVTELRDLFGRREQEE